MRKKGMKILAAAMALVLLLSTGCETVIALPATEYDTKNALTVEQMEQDLDYLEAGLEYYHADAWHSISKENFEAEITELEGRLEDMTRTQFQYEVARLVALIGDAHTTASFDDDYAEYLRELAFSIKDFDDGWYIVKTDGDHSQYLGWRIDKIGKYDREQITGMIKSYFSTETEAWTQYKMIGYVNHWDVLYLAGVVDSETVTLTLSKDGETETTVYTALPYTECNDLSYQTLSALDGYTEVETGKSSEYYRDVEFDDFLFVQYNVCQNMSSCSMTAFAGDLAAIQAEKNYQTLVIDLRYNVGGSSSVITPLCEFADAFVEGGGKLYVLIGERTFSSGIFALESLRAYNPILIGTPSGGGENHYGEATGTFTLSNCGMTIYCATKWFHVFADAAVSSAVPDITAAHTFEDYFNGIDPELAIVRKLISGELKSPEPQSPESWSTVKTESWTESFDFEKYPWANNMDGGFMGYLGVKRVLKWINSRYDNCDYPGMIPAVYAQDFDLTPEELVAVMRFDTERRAYYGGTTDYYTEEDIKAALIFAFGSDEFDEAAVPVLDFNLSYKEFWSVYGDEKIENMARLGASVENVIPWSFITEAGIKTYLEWEDSLSDRSEYTLQNFLKYSGISVVAYDSIFNTLKANTIIYSDEKIAEIRTEVYGY